MSNSPVQRDFKTPTAQDLDPRFADTVFVVEADSYARLMLWKEFGESGRVDWKEDNKGTSAILGMLDDHPINVLFFWDKLNGKRVLFYEPVSQVVDHKLVDDWLRANCNPTWDSGHRRAHCDAMNFHLCIHAIEELSEISLPNGR